MDAAFVERRQRRQAQPGRQEIGGRRAAYLVVAMIIAAVFGACRGEGLTGLPSANEVGPRSDLGLQYLGVGAREPEGTYPGFDTNLYPGDDVMQKWLDAGPYRWVGYYLVAPCHKDASWMGKRTQLEQMGWGLAVVYVGQQTWDAKLAPTPPSDPLAAPLEDCGRELVSGPRGRMEADDAILRTKSEGFPRGTVIFLDIERMENMPPRMRDYYREWTRRVAEEGTFRPGYYAHAHNANAIYADVREVLDSLGFRGYEPPFWISSAARAKAFSIEKAPEDVGHAFAHVWQGVIDIIEGRAGHRIPIDVNVARTPNPSMPREWGD